MNAHRRKQLQEIEAKITGLREQIESLQSDEQDALDNLPESLQNGDRGSAMQEAIDALDSAMEAADELIDHLQAAAA